MFFLSFLIISSAFGQDITGQWNGLLKVPGFQIRLVFHINKTDLGLSSTMDSPDQAAFGIPMSSTVFENSKITLKLTDAAIEYTGELKEGKFVGTFTQQGRSMPLDLQREAIEKPVAKRPQEPREPYPYFSEEVAIENPGAGVTLSGTLTLPSKEGQYPVVVLITGSGPQNRDEELMGHKPFLVLADYLTRNGIGVLRYDDRGTAKSTGIFSEATTLDLASDAEAALNYLKTRAGVNKEKIGLLGHSEGGIIAPMIAARSQDVRFIILLAGTGLPGWELLLLQQNLIGKASGISDDILQKNSELNQEIFNIIIRSGDSAKLKTDLANYLKESIHEFPASVKPQGMSDEELVRMLVDQYSSPWMQFFLKYDPATALSQVKCPVLAINGAKDLQVPPKENLGAIEKALRKGKNPSVTLREMPGLNHLFQECKTGSPDEYATIEQTFSPVALDVITKWIQRTLK